MDNDPHVKALQDFGAMLAISGPCTYQGRTISADDVAMILGRLRSRNEVIEMCAKVADKSCERRRERALDAGEYDDEWLNELHAKAAEAAEIASSIRSLKDHSA